MKVRCLVNDSSALSAATQVRVSKSMNIAGAIEGLVSGQVYDVLAVLHWTNGLQFLIHTIEDLAYPIPVPAEFFEVVDSRCSESWKVGLKQHAGSWAVESVGFQRFVDDPAFLERLMENDSEALREYDQYLALARASDAW